MSTIIIKHKREKSLRQHHPWVFSGSIDNERELSLEGQTVDILTHEGEFLARAAYSPHSQIRARVWTFDKDEIIDEEFFKKRISSAITLRKQLNLFIPKTFNRSGTACRLIHAESDQLPGLIVDQYSDHLVTQFLSAGAEYWKDTLVRLLIDLTGIQNIFNRSDAEIRQLEGLPTEIGILNGKVDELLTIKENDLLYRINLVKGQKTGFYLDQRDNRFQVRELAKGSDVLDCFAFTGGFSLNALAGGAKSVVTLDSSSESLSIAKENLILNNLYQENVEFLEGDAFHLLRKFRDSRRSFDMIILDPPKFAQTASQVDRAARGYKDINLLAFKLLNPGGFLVTFSCSGAINVELFQKIVAGAALDAGANARIIRRLSQSGDHPVNLNFPEGNYLKGLICIKE